MHTFFLGGICAGDPSGQVGNLIRPSHKALQASNSMTSLSLGMEDFFYITLMHYGGHLGDVILC